MRPARGFATLVAFVVGLGCTIPVVFVPRSARADGEDPRDREEAKRLFSQGSASFLAHKYAEALEDLRASYKLVPSPNSGLLIARCLRELNRRVEAVDMYSTVAADARRRAADGDSKYTQTADVAASEGAAIRATLGMVRVRVAQPTPGSRVEIDGTLAPVSDTEIVVLHVPGEVTVKLKPKTGAEQSQRATVTAGGDVRMEFTSASATDPVVPRVEPRPVPPPAASEGDPAGWTLPVALVAGGLALAGTGVFIGFRVKSDAIYNDLKSSCGMVGCTSADDRATLDSGKRDQTIADVGLAVGIVAGAAAIVFLLVRAYGPRTGGSGATHASGLVVTATSVGAAF